PSARGRAGEPDQGREPGAPRGGLSLAAGAGRGHDRHGYPQRRDTSAVPVDGQLLPRGLPGRHGTLADRQRQPRGPGPDGGAPWPLGVPPDRGAAPSPQPDGVSGQSNRGLLGRHDAARRPNSLSGQNLADIYSGTWSGTPPGSPWSPSC